MHPSDGTRALSQVLALLLIIGGIIYGLEACGIRTGVYELAVCRVGHGLVAGVGPGLVQLIVAGGIALAVLPWTRPLGFTLLGIGLVGMFGLEAWLQHAPPYCSGSTGGGFTP